MFVEKGVQHIFSIILLIKCDLHMVIISVFVPQNQNFVVSCRVYHYSADRECIGKVSGSQQIL